MRRFASSRFLVLGSFVQQTRQQDPLDRKASPTCLLYLSSHYVYRVANVMSCVNLCFHARGEAQLGIQPVR